MVLAPSPIDKPEEFAKWQDKYLELVLAKLENYEGPFLDPVSTDFALNLEHNMIHIFSYDWPVIASYKFMWHGQEMLNKTYALSNGSVKFPLTFTYTTPDSPFVFYGDFPYAASPPNDAERALIGFFGIPPFSPVKDDFMVDFLGEGYNEEAYDILLHKFFRSTITKEEALKLMEWKLIFARFNNEH